MIRSMSTIPQAGGMETWGKAKADQRPGSAKDYGHFYYIKVSKRSLQGIIKKAIYQLSKVLQIILTVI
ncbi:artefact or hypothetical protein (fragment) [Tenacibaculum maritimum]